MSEIWYAPFRLKVGLHRDWRVIQESYNRIIIDNRHKNITMTIEEYLYDDSTLHCSLIINDKRIYLFLFPKETTNEYCHVRLIDAIGSDEQLLPIDTFEEDIKCIYELIPVRKFSFQYYRNELFDK